MAGHAVTTTTRTPTSEILRARIASANGASHDETPVEGAPAAVSPEPDHHISVIGSDILITGNIEAEVDLHIEGRVIGDVRCATLILGERSTVAGNIFAQRVRVSGQVDGSIETVDLAVEAGARVCGDILYSRLRIANGGTVSGKMEHVAIEPESHTGPVGENAKGPAKVHYIE
jgi:cytoskeletal protein CcmA (bactofilin family)